MIVHVLREGALSQFPFYMVCHQRHVSVIQVVSKTTLKKVALLDDGIISFQYIITVNSNIFNGSWEYALGYKHIKQGDRKKWSQYLGPTSALHISPKQFYFKIWGPSFNHVHAIYQCLGWSCTTAVFPSYSDCVCDWQLGSVPASESVIAF